MTLHRSHASADSYDPFEDTRGPVSQAVYFDVERIPATAPDGSARFRKTIKPGVGDQLLQMIHHENMLLMDMAAHRLTHVAQSLEFTRPSSDTPFVVTTLDAGPSLNLWQRYHFARLGDSVGGVRPLLTPSAFGRLMQQLLVSLREFHAAGFIHCDIHAGNICLPFERQDGVAGAVRPLFDTLRLIDFGHTLSARLKLEEPLRLDPDAPESLRRVSPAFRSALRNDTASQRADEVNKLDFRLDLHALGALGAQLLGSVDWSSEPQAVALQPATAACVAALLTQDCDDAAPEPGLHDRLLRQLDDLVAGLGPPDDDWLLPHRRESKISPASLDTARETPLIVARLTPMAMPVAVPAAVPIPVATRPAGAAATAQPHTGPADIAPPVQRTPARRPLVVWSLAGAAVLVGAWALSNLGGQIPGQAATAPASRAASPAKGVIATPPPATAQRQSSDAAAGIALTPGQLKKHLDSMMNGAASGKWAEVESVARQISVAAAATATQQQGTSSLVAAGQRAIEGTDYQTAISTLRRATEQTPDDWKAWSALGYALLRLNQLQDAKAALNQGLRLRPQDASAWAHLGEIFALQNSKSAAARSLRLAVYFSTQRARTLAHLRQSETTLIEPQFLSVISEQGSKLDQIPERVP